MSDEIKVAFNLSAVNGYFTDRVALGQVAFDQANAGRGGTTQTFTDSESNFEQDGVTTEGLIYIRNLEATGRASFQFGPEIGTTGVAEMMCTLEPGDFAFFRMKPGVQLRGVCVPVGTAYTTCKVDIRIYED